MTDKRQEDFHELTPQVIPSDVPVFTCVVHVSPGESGVQARVANLAGLQVEAATEREALAKIVPEFKRRVGEFVQARSQVPWIEPPLDPIPGELTRLVPVHL